MTMTSPARVVPAPCVSVPHLVGRSAIDADSALHAIGLTGVYINKAGETASHPPLGRRVEAQLPMPTSMAPARGEVVIYTN